MEVKKQNGPAGRVSYTAVTEDGPVTFVGSVYGGPVVMVTHSGVQTFVTDPGRFGEFGPGWVERFLAPERRRERCPVCGGLNPGDITHTRCA